MSSETWNSSSRMHINIEHLWVSDVNLFQVQTPSTSSDTKTGAVLLQSSFSMPGPDHPVDEVERPGLLQSLSLPSSDTPYHRLRRASHHIISGVHVDFEYICYIKILLQYLRCFCERDFCNFHNIYTRWIFDKTAASSTTTAKVTSSNFRWFFLCDVLYSLHLSTWMFCAW